MKAAWYETHGAARDVLVVGAMPDPEPGPAEVRIRVAASGINPGDVKKRQDAFGYGMPYPRVIPHSRGPRPERRSRGEVARVREHPEVGLAGNRRSTRLRRESGGSGAGGRDALAKLSAYPPSKNVANWFPGPPKVQILFALFFTWRSLHVQYFALGGDFKGAAAPCVAHSLVFLS